MLVENSYRERNDIFQPLRHSHPAFPALTRLRLINLHFDGPEPNLTKQSEMIRNNRSQQDKSTDCLDPS